MSATLYPRIRTSVICREMMFVVAATPYPHQRAPSCGLCQFPSLVSFLLEGLLTPPLRPAISLTTSYPSKCLVSFFLGGPQAHPSLHAKKMVLVGSHLWLNDIKYKKPKLETYLLMWFVLCQPNLGTSWGENVLNLQAKLLCILV